MLVVSTVLAVRQDSKASSSVDGSPNVGCGSEYNISDVSQEPEL